MPGRSIHQSGAGERRAAGGPTPLRVHLLFHPDSKSARDLALHLFDVLNGPSADWGRRIPVRFAVVADDGRPVAPIMDDSSRHLVVVLVDERMARSGTPAERAVGDAWARLLEQLLETYPPGTGGSRSVLPVALDSSAFSLSRKLGNRSFVRLDAAKDRRHLDFHVAIGCLRLMRDQPASASADVDRLPPSDVAVFVSHAKRDLPRQAWRGAVAALLTAHEDLPLKPWYDSSDIPVGARFGEEINKAVERANAIIVVLTDNYSSREWCRREVLAAKAAGRPIVVVDAIESQVVRLFPYIGNAPTVRWRAALAEATDPDARLEPVGVREAWEAEDASTALLVTLLEALRYEHELARLRLIAGTTDVVLGTHPEALTVAAVPPGTTRVVYPDPPLGREELHWVKNARASLDLITPLERLARRETSADCDLVAVSLSGAPDAHRYGGTELHLATLAHDMALYLLLAGLRLLYGGMLGHGAVGRDGRAPGDEVNYVERLMELVERYSPLAREVGRPLTPIENWLAWPLHEELTEEQRNHYHRDRATMIEVPPPDDLDVDANQLQPGADGRYPRDTPLWRYVRARCLTKMRADSTSAATARVAMGGKLHGYEGTLPGVAEEALLTLRAGKPLYLLGSFGGATRMVIDLLRGQQRVELTTAWCEQNVTGWDELINQCRALGHPASTPEEVTAELRQLGAAGLASALGNGLSDAENDELGATTDAHRAVELVLGGLQVVATTES